MDTGNSYLQQGILGSHAKREIKNIMGIVGERGHDCSYVGQAFVGHMRSLFTLNTVKLFSYINLTLQYSIFNFDLPLSEACYYQVTTHTKKVYKYFINLHCMICSLHF